MHVILLHKGYRKNVQVTQSMF